MDEIEELKRALGPHAKDYDNTQLRSLSRELDFAAEFLLDLYLFRKAKARKERQLRFDTPPQSS
jgi:hypothetical protein